MRLTSAIVWWLGLTLLCPLALSGCNSSVFSGDRGPAATLNSDEVVSASAKVNLIMASLAADNGIIEGEPGSYYDVSVAGFNFVDDQCNAYFDHLFFLDRERSTVKSLLSSANATSSAILGVTNAGQVTLLVVAQAFGFASAATDAAANTFLYQLPPATTLGFVAREQTAFRAGAILQYKDGAVRTRQDAYHLIQQYLALCLPPNIEAELVKQISGTTSAPDREAPLGSVAIVTGSAPPTSVPQVKRNLPSGSAAIMRSDFVPIARNTHAKLVTPVIKPHVAGVKLEEERLSLTIGQVREIQQVVCSTGEADQLGPATRAKIQQFFDGVEKSGTNFYPSQPPATDHLTLEGVRMLIKAHDKFTGSKARAVKSEACVDLNTEQVGELFGSTKN